MTPQQVVDLSMGCIYAATELGVPLLVTALAVGLLVSVFQAATQINESTLSFLPKIVAMIVVFVMTAPWMITKLTNYTKNLYEKIPEIVRVHK